jgi:hypothetical protein
VYLPGTNAWAYWTRSYITAGKMLYNVGPRYHSNIELKQSVKYMKRYVGDDYTFIINRVKVSDRGEFIIRAENHYGVTEEVVFLNVQPTPREIPRYTPEPLPVR